MGVHVPVTKCWNTDCYLKTGDYSCSLKRERLVINDPAPRSLPGPKACSKSFRMKLGAVDSNLSPALFSTPVIPFGAQFLICLMKGWSR